MEKLPKREYPVERVVGHGFSAEELNGSRSVMREAFENQEFPEMKEREKNEDDMSIIGWVNEMTNATLEQYGMKPLDVPAKNIHIILPEHWPNQYEDSDAVFEFDRQSLLYKDIGWQSAFAVRLHHEMIHMKSHQAAQLITIEGKQRMKQYRAGLALVSQKRNQLEPLFHKLNEAITEQLAIEFWRIHIRKNPMFEREVEKIDLIKELFLRHVSELAKINDVLEEEEREVSDEIFYILDKQKIIYGFFSYREERLVLNELVQKLYEANKGKFKTEREAFDLFAKSHVTGHMVELGRVIDTTFGKGTLRRLGELSAEWRVEQESENNQDGERATDEFKNQKTEDLLRYIKSLQPIIAQ